MVTQQRESVVFARSFLRMQGNNRALQCKLEVVGLQQMQQVELECYRHSNKWMRAERSKAAAHERVLTDMVKHLQRTLAGLRKERAQALKQRKRELNRANARGWGTGPKKKRKAGVILHVRWETRTWIGHTGRPRQVGTPYRSSQTKSQPQTRQDGGKRRRAHRLRVVHWRDRRRKEEGERGQKTIQCGSQVRPDDCASGRPVRDDLLQLISL